MIFTIKPKFLIRLLKRISESQWDGPISLFASRGRVELQANGIVGETCAQVWDDGQCRVLAPRLFEIVRRFQLETGITIYVNGGFLRIRSAAVPVLSAGAWTATSENLQCDFATD